MSSRGEHARLTARPRVPLQESVSLCVARGLLVALCFVVGFSTVSVALAPPPPGSVKMASGAGELAHGFPGIRLFGRGRDVLQRIFIVVV